MTRFTKPDPGSRICVVTDRTEEMRLYGMNVPRIHETRGEVLPPAKHDDPLTVRMTTGRSDFPVAVIPLRWITVLEHSDGTEQGTTEEKAAGLFHQEVVKGSKKDKYTVTRQTNGSYSCTCTGFRFRGHCKHINEVKEKLEG